MLFFSSAILIIKIVAIFYDHITYKKKTFVKRIMSLKILVYIQIT